MFIFSHLYEDRLQQMLRSMAINIEIDRAGTNESDYQERRARREIGPRMMTSQMSPSSGLIWNRALEKMIKERVGNHFCDMTYCSDNSLDQTRLRRDAKKLPLSVTALYSQANFACRHTLCHISL